VRAGQPFPWPFGASFRAALLASTIALASTACGGSTEVATLTGPDGVRCQTTVSTAGTSVGADGGSIAVAVAAARDCTWTASADASWMQLSATSGQGDGSFTLSVARNEQPSTRTGNVSVNDRRVAISQEGRPCTFDLRGPSGRVSSGGNRIAVEVVTASECAWTAATSASWIILDNASGTGPGAVRADVAPNPGPARSAGISIGGQQYTVQQNGAADDGNVPLPPDCTPVLDQRSLELPQTGGSGSVSLTINGACDWSATSDSAWLTVAPPSGRGSASVTMAAQANTGANRSATVTIAQQTVNVTQPGSCLATIDPASRSFNGTGGQGAVRVTTAGSCEWNASGGASWTRITIGRGTGSGEARYEVLPNATGSARQTTITIGGRSHAIAQQPCTFSLAPASRTVPAAGGAGTVQVTTEVECPWSVSGGADWVSVSSSSSRTGPGEFSYAVAPNTSSSSRTATLTVGGRTHAITQEAAPAPACTYSVQPAARTFPAAGGQAALTVQTQAGCQWTLAGGGGWVQAASTSGTGASDVSYTVQPNTATTPRTTTLVVNGQTHTITQDAAPAPTCTYAVRPDARSFPASGGPGSLTVATQTGCQWTLTGGDGWAVPATTSGTGQADVAYMVQPNTATTVRTTTLVVNGQTHTITQDAAAPPPPPCTYTLDPASRTIPAAGGDAQFNVVTQAGCQWTTSGGAGWITIGTNGGTGSGAVTYKVQANTTTSQRVASINAGGQTHVVTQEAATAAQP
jgi:hypothetical protein